MVCGQRFLFYWRPLTKNFSLSVIPLNTLRPKQNGRYFEDSVFKCLFVEEIFRITNTISSKHVLIDKMFDSALVLNRRQCVKMTKLTFAYIPHPAWMSERMVPLKTAWLTFKIHTSYICNSAHFGIIHEFWTRTSVISILISSST